MTVWLVRLFPLAALVLAAAAVQWPTLFIPFKGGITPLLALIMFGMGITLEADDFRRVVRRPAAVAIGVTLQFLIMPAVAWLVARVMGLPSDLTAGMILVGSVSGGTASNVICYLAGADVALSISMTAVSTMLGVVLTPLLTWFYLGRTVDVPVAKMLADIFMIVFLPVAGGLAVNHYLHRLVRPCREYFPLISVGAIVLVIAIIVALNRDRLAQGGLAVLFAVMLHNGIGIATGYGICRLLRLDRIVCRTIAIEVGMQNSGLAVMLASKYFSAAAALPGAIFSIWHNLAGSFLAACWARGKRSESGD